MRHYATPFLIDRAHTQNDPEYPKRNIMPKLILQSVV